LFAIRDDPRLWGTFKFGRQISTPPVSVFYKFIKRAPEATSLLVENTIALGLTDQKLMSLFRYLTNLRHLHLERPSQGVLFRPVDKNEIFPRLLETLTLRSITAPMNGSFYTELLEASKLTLRQMELVGVRERSFNYFPSLMPCLTVLKLDYAGNDARFPHGVIENLVCVGS
jgi:hypothetical protein